MKMKTRTLVTLAMLTAIVFVVQVGMAFLPNIELVSLLIILYTRVYRKKVFFIIYAFALLEGLFYGFGVWWVNYLYVWSLLAVAVLLIHSDSVLLWSIVSGVYGLCYGFLCAIPYFVVGGFAAGGAYWIAGIPYDILHCIGNVVLCVLLYKPLNYVMTRLACMPVAEPQTAGK